MGERLLVQGGYLLSMDVKIGEMSADVLVEERRIAAIAPELHTQDAEVLDVPKHALMPGFVDTHRHSWQTPFRGVR